jgi:hypothetical protein
LDCLDHGDTATHANSCSSTTRHQKSSQLGKYSGGNNFQAITQQQTGLLQSAMYLQKAHGTPDMTLALSWHHFTWVLDEK